MSYRHFFALLNTSSLRGPQTKEALSCGRKQHSERCRPLASSHRNWAPRKETLPNSSSLICCPSQYVSTLESRLTRPHTVYIESICQILQTGGALEHNHVFASLWVLVLQRWYHPFWVDRVEPLILGVDDGEHVWEIQLGRQDQGLDVIDVGCLVRWEGLSELCCDDLSLLVDGDSLGKGAAGVENEWNYL